MTAPNPDASAAGTVAFGDLTVPRLGFGTMRLTGPRIFGPPEDRDECIRVLRRAVELGVRLIDSSWYYGPYVVDELIREALSPYPDDLLLLMKHGGARTDNGGWRHALTPEELRQGVETDLRLLGVEALPATHLRWMDNDAVEFEESFEAMLALVAEGKVQRLGLSNVSLEQVSWAAERAPIVSVSNAYGVTNRDDDAVVDRCAELGIAYVPFFGLGASPARSGEGVSRSAAVAGVAERHGVTPAQVAIAWALHRSPTIAPIPGTSKVAHLEENVAAAALTLSEQDIADLAA